MQNRFLKKFDFPLIFDILILIVFGIIFIYSAGIDSSGTLVKNFYVKQIIWACISLAFMIFFTLYDYRKTQNYAFYLYIALVVILVITRLFGHEAHGAKSWIGIGDIGIQPSEFGKVIFILYLAKFFAEAENMSDMKKFLISLGIMCIPVGLILIQPDLGSASVYIPIFLVVAFMAGVNLKYLGYILLFGVMAIVFSVLPYLNQNVFDHQITILTVLTNYKLMMILIAAMATIAAIGFIIKRYFHGPSYIYWITYVFSAIALALLFSLAFRKVLKEYQLQRLVVFLNPYKDGKNGLGAGWNIIQSKIAIGSGGLFGKGYLNGSQSHLRYLPEQHTDFIFGIYEEEFGFMGGILFFILYGFIFAKLLYLIKKCTNTYGLYITSGILAMFFFHFVTNVGMVMGVMPITGIPLLFMSYGGSSLITSMSCIGIVMNINYRRKEFMSIG